jgi:DNA-binding transcriptional MerR regulator
MAQTSLPPKLYFRIGEVAELVGVEPHVLRYWEREFRSIRPTKSAKGQRVYSRRDVENLMRVRQLLYSEGFTIAGAKKKLQRAGVEADAETQVEAEVATESDGVQVAAADASKTREQLVAMRREIEAFLGELGPSRRS